MEKIINMVIDCFTFFNELDMLEFRLTELDEVVDTFIIVESTKTFSGMSKELYFHKNKKRFSKWLHKIHYHVVDDAPTGFSTEHTWFREGHQRNSIKFPLSQISPKRKDIILLSDLDEIPSVDLLKKFKTTKVPNNAVCLNMDWYYYNLTTKINVPPNDKPKCFYYDVFIDSGLTLDQIRNQHWTQVDNAGWHLTYFMSVDEIIKKVESFSHQEYNTKEILNPERLRELIKEGKDIFPGRKENYLFYNLPIDQNQFLPKNYKFWLENNRTL